MLADCGLCLCDVATTDCLEDIVVLNDEDLAFVSVLDVLEAVAVHLLSQIVQNLNEAVVSGSVVNDVVVAFIGLCHAHCIAGGDCNAERILCFLKFTDVIFGHTLAGKLDCKFLEGTANLKHIAQTLLGNLCDFCSLSRNHENETLQLEFADCLADRGTAYAEAVGKLNLHQTFTRLKFAF